MRLILLFALLLLAGCPVGNDDDTTQADDDDTTQADDDDTTLADDDDTTQADDDDTTQADDDDTTLADDDDSGSTVVPVGDWTAIACGNDSICVLDEVGQPFCAFRQSSQLLPGAMGAFIELSVSSRSACALDASGFGTCWGLDMVGSLNIPQVPLYSLQRACALRQSDGLIDCWFTNAVGENPPLAGDWLQLHHRGGSSGTGCFRSSERIACFDAVSNQTTFNFAGDFVDIAGEGVTSICGLTPTGAIQCIGSNSAGVLDAPASTGWIDIAGHSNVLCARAADGNVECWGGGGIMSGTTAPGPMSEICDSWGSAWMCGIELGSGDIRCWGPSLPSNLQQFL